MSERVRRIDDGGDEIDVLIDVMDAIASRTNLLALNASIEAARARAGPGRGSRWSPRRSSRSRRSHSVAVRHRGVARRDQLRRVDAIANLEAISDPVDELDVGVGQVATATDQQAAGAEEIATMVDRTAENAAGILDQARAIDDAVRGRTTAIRDANGRVDVGGDDVRTAGP